MTELAMKRGRTQKWRREREGGRERERQIYI